MLVKIKLAKFPQILWNTYRDILFTYTAYIVPYVELYLKYPT